MLGHRTYPSKSVGRITVLALTAVIVVAVAVALSLVLTCSAVDIPLMQPELDNAAVGPQESGTWNQTFTYAVNCIFSDTVNITLEVYSLSLHDWTARGDRAYTGTGERQSLTWADVKLCSGKCEGTSSYRFKYNGSILLTESGPTIAPPAPLPPTIEIFKNAMVKPAYGHYNDSFTYSVFAQLNQTRNITMEVFDISSYEWKPVGAAYYSDKGNWQLLSWADVTNVPAADSAGVASYRFFFIDAGARRESVVFYGPELGLYPTPAPAPVVIRRGGGGGISRGGLLEDEVFQKELAEKLGPFIVPGCVEIEPPVLISATVTPTRGSWHESYDYSVVVEHPNRADMWLTLVVYCPGQRENRTISSQAIWDYNETTNRATVEWRGVNVFSEEDARANELPSYYIYYNDGCNKDYWWCFGPELDFTSGLTEPSVSPEEGTYKEHVEIEPPELINATVTPRRGSWHESYDYCAVVEHPNRADMWLTLEVYCPGQRENYTSSSQRVWMYDDANIARVEWRDVNVFNEEDVRANESPRYYILYNDGYNKDSVGFPGPELHFPPVLTNPSVSPEEGTYKEQFEYKVDVMDEEEADVNVTLYILDSEGSEIYNKTHVINGTEAKGGKTESWTYKFTEEAAADSEFRYYFSATEGIVSNITAVRVGPYINKHREFSLLWIIILAIIAGLAVVSGVLWLVYNRFFKREIEEEIV